MEQEANKSLVIAVIITFVIAFWLGFLVGWLITGRRTDQGLTTFQGEKNRLLSEKENMGATQKPLPTSGEENSIRGEDQLAGENASMDMITFDREGWVVIHEDNEGAPGAILGAAWLPAGSHKNVNIALLRNTEPGRRYYAMLHHEVNDGSKSHLFDLGKDLPMQDAGGNIIMISFKTISSPR